MRIFSWGFGTTLLVVASQMGCHPETSTFDSQAGAVGPTDPGPQKETDPDQGTADNVDPPVINPAVAAQRYVAYTGTDSSLDQPSGEMIRTSCNSRFKTLSENLLPLDANSGWSTIDEAHLPAGAVAIYASRGPEAQDTNSGLSSQEPVKSLTQVKLLMKGLIAQGRVPWVFFARGSAWEVTGSSPISSLPIGNTRADLPEVLASYGPTVYYSANPNDVDHPQGMEQRPRFYPNAAEALTGQFPYELGVQGSSATGQFLALVGLEFAGTYHVGPGKGPQSGIFIRSLGGLLLEDTYIWGFRTNNINVDNRYTPDTIGLVKIRRSILGENNNINAVDTPIEKAALFAGQGLYIDNVFKLVIEQTIFDHAGWGRSATGVDNFSDRNEYRHAIYTQGPYAPSGKAQGNIPTSPGICRTLVRQSIFVNDVDGTDLKEGGDSINNLMMKTGIALDYGYRSIGHIKHNVILDGINMRLNGTAGNEGAQSGTGIFLNLSNTPARGRYLDVSENIIAHNLSAYAYRNSVSEAAFRPGNTVYDWYPDGNPGNTFTDSSVDSNFTQPTSIEGYLRSKSLTGNYDTYMAKLKNMSRLSSVPNYFDIYAADSVNQFYRSVFRVTEPADNLK